MNSFTTIFLISCLILVLDLSPIPNSGPKSVSAGHGHGKDAGGTACIVKGSYCSCHYCKCEHGSVHCGGKKKHGGYGKKFCYGSTEGQYCHCDYCKCAKGYGSTGKYGKCH